MWQHGHQLRPHGRGSVAVSTVRRVDGPNHPGGDAAGTDAGSLWSLAVAQQEPVDVHGDDDARGISVIRRSYCS